MKNAVIIHGTYADSASNWFPWLKDELTEIGYQVSVPDFPTPSNQTIENWIKILDRHTGYDNETILIGHSSAPLVICAKLARLEKPVKAVYLISPFHGFIGNKEYDQANKEFVEHKTNWQKAKENAGKITIYRGDNDPYVPGNIGSKVAEYLEVEETIIEGGGHLNAEAGFNKLTKLLEDIKGLS